MLVMWLWGPKNGRGNGRDSGRLLAMHTTAEEVRVVTNDEGNVNPSVRRWNRRGSWLLMRKVRETKGGWWGGKESKIERRGAL